MNRETLLAFKGELENIATYNRKPVNEEEFREFFKKLRDYTIKNSIDMPEIFRYTGNELDFRRKIQKYSTYEERRQKIDDAIYELCDKIDKINYRKSEVSSQKILDKKDLIRELKSKKQIQTKYGTISFNSLDIKEGGNSIVVFGNFQGEKVAVKILVSNSSNKINRFLCEFANVIIKLADLQSVAKVYFYDTAIIGTKVVDIIVMKQYYGTLAYDENYTEEEIISIFKQIIDCIEEVHKRGIIHRDLKPKNILLDENSNVVITDFGIAYYNPEIFDITGHTTSGERLANFDFSPPEQRDSKDEPQKTMDIYAIGQIVQWLVFGQVHKGTNRRRLMEKYNTKRMKFLDSIVQKCLDNSPKNRYQSIEEIKAEMAKYNVKNRGTNVMSETTDIPLSVEEIKEKLIDILDNICGTGLENRKFIICNQLSKTEILNFLESLNYNLSKLQFFEKVTMSKFLNIYVYKAQSVDKMFFEELHKLYYEVKLHVPEILPSFLEYVTEAINDNYSLLPF